MSLTTFSVTCFKCGKVSTLEINGDAFEAWRSGKIVLLQDAFPDLSAGDRELIKTGIDQQCWDEMFGGEQ